MIGLLKKPRWSPYLVGAGIGVLSWCTFYFMGKALGTSTSFVGAAGAGVCSVAPEHVAENAYYVKEYGAKAGGFKPIFDWQMSLDLALIVGAFLAAWLGGTLRAERVPTVWAERFGPSVLKRYSAAFIGGFILVFGARMAGGCTSGHGISGMMQIGMIEGLSVKATELAMNAGGGLIFGVGMVLLGYCAGTALAAIGQGSRDAIVGVVGALVGAGVYAEAYPLLARTVEPM